MLNQTDLAFVNSFTSFVAKSFGIPFGGRVKTYAVDQHSMERLTGHKHALGATTETRDGDIIVLVRFDWSVEDVCYTIAHEFAHAKQIIDGKLSYDSAGRNYWCDERLQPSRTKEEQEACPCETEANDMATKVCEAFAMHLVELVRTQSSAS